MPWHLLALLFPLAAPPLSSAAVRAEVMDPRECAYVLARPADFPADLALIVRRCNDLALAPPLSDCRRLPPRGICNDAIVFNRAYAAHIDALRAVDLRHGRGLLASYRAAERLYRVWDCIRDTQAEYYYVSVRREALKRLRDELLGPEAYFRLDLPPPVPVGRFRAAD